VVGQLISRWIVLAAIGLSVAGCGTSGDATNNAGKELDPGTPPPPNQPRKFGHVLGKETPGAPSNAPTGDQTAGSTPTQNPSAPGKKS